MRYDIEKYSINGYRKNPIQLTYSSITTPFRESYTLIEAIELIGGAEAVVAWDRDFVKLVETIPHIGEYLPHQFGIWWDYKWGYDRNCDHQMGVLVYEVTACNLSHLSVIYSSLHGWFKFPRDS